MKRQLVPCAVVASLLFGAQTSRAQRYEGWQSSPDTHSEPPGGKKNEERKKKKKKEQQLSNPDSSSSPAAPGAPTKPGPSLEGVGLPGMSPPFANLAAGVGGALGGGAAGGAAAAPSGAAAGGAAAAGAGAVGAAVGAGAVGAGGAVPVGAAAGATSLAAFANLKLAAVGAALIGPHDAVALTPNMIDLLKGEARADLTSDAEDADLVKSADRMLVAGNVSLACQLFERALSAKRTAANLLRLSQCHDKAGRVASAWLGFTTVADAADESGTRAKGAAESARLGSALPRLTFAVVAPPGSASPSVSFDGHPVMPQHWGRALPLDPGEHVVIIRAPGQPEWKHPVVVARDTRELVVKWPEPRLADAAPAQAPETRPWYVSNRVLFTSSLTLVVAAVSAASAVWTLSARSDFVSRNGQPGSTAQDLTDLHDTTRTRGIITTALFGATAVGVGLTTLFVFGDSGDSKPPPTAVKVSGWVDGGGGGLVLRGKL